MSYHGDTELDDIMYIWFTTVAPATGAPTTLSGGAAVVYMNGNPNEVTSGITLTADFDGRTGFNLVAATCTVANGFTAGDAAVVLSAGTVGGVSAVGYVVGSFSIQSRSTVRVLGDVEGDVLGNVNGSVASVTGNVGGNVVGSVASVTGAVGSVTGNVGGNVTGSVASVTGAVGSVTGNVGGNVTGSVGSVAAGGITAASVATGAIDADALAADAVTEIQNGLASSSAITALNDLSAADVKAQVVAALTTDTYPEPGTGAPPAAASLEDKLGYLYKAWRNRTTQTATQYSLFGDDATTVHQKAAVSDDGTTLNRAEVASGP